MKSSLMVREPELIFDSLHQELNNLLKDTFLESELLSPLNIRKISTWRPAVELKQNDKDYKIKIQLPGVNKEDIHVDLENDYMTVTAEFKEEKHEKKGNGGEEKIHTNEFRYGKFVRTISFDNPIQSDASVAEYTNGILNITLPKQKVEKHKTKRLEVK